MPARADLIEVSPKLRFRWGKACKPPPPSNQVSWKYCAMAEKLINPSFLWVGSRSAVAYTPIEATDVLYRGEAKLDVDWSLPLSEHGHLWLMQRLFADYERDTKIVALEKSPVP